MILSNTGKFYTTGKSSFTDDDPGFFLGYDVNTYKLNIGNSTNFIKWDGSNLSVAGTMTISNTSTVAGTAASSLATAHQTAGGSSTGNSRAHVNSDGLVVVDSNGIKRVKIGNLTAL